MDENEILDAEEGKKKYRKWTDAERVKVVYKIITLMTPTVKSGKYQKGKSLTEALDEVDVSPNQFALWRKKYPELDELFRAAKEGMMESIKSQSRGILDAALNGKLKLKDKELVEIAIRTLEKTDDQFKDKKEVELKGGIDFNKSLAELEREARLLLGLTLEDAGDK